jgi:hypothetical protein
VRARLRNTLRNTFAPRSWNSVPISTRPAASSTSSAAGVSGSSRYVVSVRMGSFPAATCGRHRIVEYRA